MASRASSVLLSWVALVGAGGCFPPDDGRSPHLDQFYFPVGLAVNEARTRLYVANSDFDLQYNAGTLQAFDLDGLRGALPTYCDTDAACDGGKVCDFPGAATNRGGPTHWCVDPAAPAPCPHGEKSAAERLNSPGRCKGVDPALYQKAKVMIGAFVTDVVYRRRPSDAVGGAEARLFLPVRGDDTLHWVDVDAAGTELDCGQGTTETCDGNHRRGDAPAEENTRAVRLPPEPFGVAVDETGEALLMTHQSDGAVALFVNDWSDGPRLEFVLDGLPSGALGVAHVPVAQAVRAVRDDPTVVYQQAFLVTFRTSPEVRLVRYFPDRSGSPARPFLEAATRAFIQTNSEGFDSRGIAIDDWRRVQCEAASCADPTTEACRQCTGAGFDVYVANRAPASLIAGEALSTPGVIPPNDVPKFFDSMRVSLGASRVVMGNVRAKDGTKVRRIFVICFDSKEIWVYDPDGRRFETVIQTGRGPHAITIDDGGIDAPGDPPGKAYAYIAHFTDSYLGVVDLNQAHATYGETVLTVGTPIPPRAQK